MDKKSSVLFGEVHGVVEETKAPALIRKRINENNKKVGSTKGAHNQNRNQQYRNKGNLHSNKLVKKGDLEQ